MNDVTESDMGKKTTQSVWKHQFILVTVQKEFTDMVSDSPLQLTF